MGFASIFAAGLDELIFAVPRSLYAVLTLPLIGLALTALAVVLRRARLAGVVLDARARVCFTPRGWWRRSPSCGS